MLRRRLAAAGIEAVLSTAVVVGALLLAGAVVATTGASPAETASVFFSGAFGGTSQIGATVQDMVPLVLVALGWILVFSSGRFHVGFQGQILVGGLFAAIVGLEVSGLPALVHLPLAAVAGVLGGVLYAAIAAWLWARRSINEVLSTLLLNLVAIQVINWVVRGPLQESARILPQTEALPDSARWPTVPGFSLLHWDILLVPAAVAIVACLLVWTRFGYRLRLVGANEGAARYAGVSPRRMGVLMLLASGGFAGLAGAALIQSGDTRAMADRFDAGYGFQGIAVALLARNSPVACIPAALLFAALSQGGGVVEAQVGVSSALVDITQGVVICFVIGAAGALHLVRGRSLAVGGRSTRSPGPAAPQAGMPGTG